MIGHELLRRWTGVPLLTLLTFPRLWGLETRVDAPAPLLEGVRQCRAVDADLSECAVLAGAPNAQHLAGLEWVLSDAAYQKLSDDDRRCWRRRPGGYWISRGSPSESWRGPGACR